jgi:hypothetical protein
MATLCDPSHGDSTTALVYVVVMLAKAAAASVGHAGSGTG